MWICGVLVTKKEKVVKDEGSFNLQLVRIGLHVEDDVIVATVDMDRLLIEGQM